MISLNPYEQMNTSLNVSDNKKEEIRPFSVSPF